MFWQHRLEHLHATLLLFIARAYPRVDVSWLGHLLNVLSEAKFLNAVKGQKVAGSSPVHPTKRTFFAERSSLVMTQLPGKPFLQLRNNPKIRRNSLRVLTYICRVILPENHFTANSYSRVRVIRC